MDSPVGPGPYLNKDNTELTMTYPAFLDAVDENQVQSVILNEKNNTFKAVLKNKPEVSYTVPNPKTEDFIEFLLTSNITLDYGEVNLPVKFLQVAF